MKKMYKKPKTQEEKLMTQFGVNQMLDVSNGPHDNMQAAPRRSL